MSTKTMWWQPCWECLLSQVSFTSATTMSNWQVGFCETVYMIIYIYIYIYEHYISPRFGIVVHTTSRTSYGKRCYFIIKES